MALTSAMDAKLFEEDGHTDFAGFRVVPDSFGGMAARHDPALPCTTVTCVCCGKRVEIDLLRLCSRCGDFTHEAGESGCAGTCACDARRKR